MNIRRRSVRWSGWLLVAICVMGTSILWFKHARTKGPAVPHAMQVQRGDVAANLGGVPVVIPRHFANYVEYEGDPGWGEKRIGPRPERSQASKLISFGFDVRFPDMVGLSTPALEVEKRSTTIYNTMWIGVGVNTGKIYPGSGFLGRRASHINDPDNQFRYDILPELQHGLTVYAPAGMDPKTQLRNRLRNDAKDIFLHRDMSGRVDAYISCSNRQHRAASCRHDFSMEPFMQAQIYVSYRRDLLPEWQQIQSSVTQLLTSFETSQAAAQIKQK